MKPLLICLYLLLGMKGANAVTTGFYNETYRPQFHFTLKDQLDK